MVLPERTAAEPAISRSFASDLVPLPSNLEGLKLAALFAEGRVAFGVILGASGWGKTHILEAAAERLAGKSIQVLQATEWAARGHRSDAQSPLILDNSQDALSKTRTRFQLLMGLERRVRAGRPTLLALTGTDELKLRPQLPRPREWSIAMITPPTACERELLVAQLARKLGLRLSEDVFHLLAHRMGGNGLTLMGALQRLQLERSQWLGDEGTLAACGLLGPFFADDPGWDLAELVCDAARSAGVEPSLSQSASVYVLLRIARLPECWVARHFEVSPAKAYAEARRWEQRMRTCPTSIEATRTIVETAVRALPEQELLGSSRQG